MTAPTFTIADLRTVAQYVEDFKTCEALFEKRRVSTSRNYGLLLQRAQNVIDAWNTIANHQTALGEVFYQDNTNPPMSVRAAVSLLKSEKAAA